MDILGLLLPFLNDYFILVSILGSMFLGNFYIFFVSTLIPTGTVVLWKVFLAVFIGVNITDCFWFFVSRSKPIGKLYEKFHREGNYPKVAPKNLSAKHLKYNLLVLAISKFVYGLEAMTVVYFGKKGLSFRKFLSFNVPISVVWVSIFISVGYLAGKGYLEMVQVYDNFRVALTIVFVLLILFYFLWRMVSRILLTDVSRIERRKK